MDIFSIILVTVGFGLLALGAVSAVALFRRALRAADKVGDETNVGTLWGLFLLGMCAGLFLIWWGL